MTVKVEIPRTLRAHTGGLPVVQADGADLKEVLDDLCGQHPGLTDRVLTRDGRLCRFINVYVNDDDVRARKTLGHRLAEGDVVTIIPAMAGGA